MRVPRVSQKPSAPRQKKLPRTVRLVLVRWEDAAHQADESEAIGTILAWSCGFFIYQNEKELAICRDVFQDGDKQEILAIPAGMVRNVKTLARIPISNED